MEKKSNLEEAVHRELRSLPPRKAPETLMPGVLAALALKARRPWWQRSWQHWPRNAQRLTLVAGSLGVLAVTGGAGWAWHAWISKPLAEASLMVQSIVVSSWALMEALVGAAGAAAQLAGSGLWAGLAGMVVASYWLCAGAGAWCYRSMIAKR